MNCNTTHYRANSSSVPGDPTSDTFEQAAEDTADRIMSGGHSDTQGGDAGGGHSSVQREAGAGEEDEAVQGLWVQREEKAPEEEEEPVQGLWVQREEQKAEEEEPATA